MKQIYKEIKQRQEKGKTVTFFLTFPKQQVDFMESKLTLSFLFISS